MSEFRFKELEVSPDKTVEYTFYQIETSPVFKVLQATDANKPYWNGQLRRNSAAARRLRGGQITAALLDETRDADRELFAKHVVKSWAEVYDTSGQPVVFSSEDCLNFLRAIPNHVFDEFRGFCTDVNNFLEAEAVDEEATSGN